MGNEAFKAHITIGTQTHNRRGNKNNEKVIISMLPENNQMAVNKNYMTLFTFRSPFPVYFFFALFSIFTTNEEKKNP